MQRTIKFRGKRLDNGEWVYGGITRPFNGGSVAILVSENGEHYFYEVDPTTVGEYTTLRDKNGVEIYEGNIVSAPFDEWSVPVVFRSARYELDGPSYVNQSNFQENPHVYRVIGNIYENPELLTQEETIHGN